MATQSKAQFLADVLTLLKKRYKPVASAQKFSVLEAVIFGICHEGVPRAKAEAALEAFKTGFFDWNEVRVSAVAEIQAVMEKAGIRDAEDRANRLRRFLRQLFEKSYGFNLDPLAKKPQKDAVKSLQEYEAIGSDFVQATVTRLALGGHAIGIDAPTRRALERLGVADPGSDDASLRGTLERAVPKTRGPEFVDLIEALAHDTCVPGEPDCPRCELRKICPTGQARKAGPPAKAAKPAPAPAPVPPVKAAPPEKKAVPPKAAGPAPKAEPPKAEPPRKAAKPAPTPPPPAPASKEKPGRSKG